jgi:uncharacterized protein (DUF1499 family)
MRLIGGIVQLIFFGVLIFVALLAAGVIANRLPLSDPPGLATRLSTYLNTHVAETTEDSPFAELRLRRYEAPDGLLFDIVRRAVLELKWDITNLDAQQKELQAVVTTKIWRFKDDVTIQVRPGQPSGSVLWVRSVSRVGKGDLGANTRHVLDLVEAVNAIAPVQALTPQQKSDEK